MGIQNLGEGGDGTWICSPCQGPTLTFEGTCPFGQSDPKFCLPEKKSTCPKEKCYFALFLSFTQ